MREITPKLTPQLERHCGSNRVWQAPPFPVSTYSELVAHAARLAYLNRDDLLFFRGQDEDYQSRAKGSTLYPAIYGGDRVPAREIRYRFELLDQAAVMLVERFKQANIEGHTDLRRKRYIQWSILQHYEVTNSPLLDLTHSLRVACSFAQHKSTSGKCYVYVLGLPYVTNRITINSEHDVVNIRLLSICPPAALRPYYQEGYLAGTTHVTNDLDSKTELDFRNRLVAKFVIPSSKSFWEGKFNAIGEGELFPKQGTVFDLCSTLKEELRYELQPGHSGEFLNFWVSLESYVVDAARRQTARNLSVREATLMLSQRGLIPAAAASEIDAIQKGLISLC